MANSLRVIYNNLVDLTTTSLSGTTGLTSINNLKSDAKGKTWRVSGTSASVTVSFGSSRPIGGIIFAFCNLTPAATISVSGASGFTSTTAAPYSNSSQWENVFTPTSASMYSYGAGTYARIWANGSTQPSSSSITINISDPTNSSGYLEFGRLVVGSYWSPTYNTSYGLSSSVIDLSKNERTEAGDLVSFRGPKYNTLSFDLKYMDKTDRTNFLNVIRTNGTSKPLFVSLFPNDSDPQKEGQHQIYGKLSQISPISYPYLDIYSTQLELEEV